MDKFRSPFFEDYRDDDDREEDVVDSDDDDFNPDDDDDGIVLSVRMLFRGVEVLSVLRNDGRLDKEIDQVSKADIFLSDGTVEDRILTAMGDVTSVVNAFKVIARKVEEFAMRIHPDCNEITIKLIVPATLCGSLIGKAGSKIKEMREKSGAQIQVSATTLPNSTERLVTVVGKMESVCLCISEVCFAIAMASQKPCNVLPYQPTANVPVGPLVVTEGKAYTIHGEIAIPVAADLSKVKVKDGMLSDVLNTIPDIVPSSAEKAETSSGKEKVKFQGLVEEEMRVSNDLIGCVIGKAGAKIAEIRQLTGAIIRITSSDDHDASGSEGRLISIHGTEDSITLAKYLILMSVEVHKALMEGQNLEAIPNSVSNAENMLSKPGVITALSNLTALGGVSDLFGSSVHLAPVYPTGLYRAIAKEDSEDSDSELSDSNKNNQINSPPHLF